MSVDPLPEIPGARCSDPKEIICIFDNAGRTSIVY